MSSLFALDNLLWIIGSLLLGAAYARLLYAGNGNLGKKLLLGLSVFRAFTVATIIYLLLAPLIRQTSFTYEKPIIVIAHDNSLSVKEIKPKNFDSEAYENNLKQLNKTLESKYEVKTYSFGDTVSNGLNFEGKAPLSNAGILFNKINDEFSNRNLGAVIIASDGIFNRGGNPIYEIKKNKTPVYTIALGDTVPRRDVAIANVNYNKLVYLDNEFNIEIQIQAWESKGENTKIIVSEEGKKIQEKDIKIDKNNFVKDFTVKLKANKIGMHRYDIYLSPTPHELTIKNNRQSIFVEVIDGRQRVLLASAMPHPDLSVLKQGIEDNKHYSVNTVIGQNLDTVRLEKYSLILTYQLPSNYNLASNFLKKLSGLKINTWYIVGLQTNLHLFNQQQQLLSFSRANGQSQEVYPVYDNNFSLFTLESNALKQLSGYPPLLVPFANTQMKGVFNTVINQRIGEIDTDSPLLFFAAEDNNKSAYLMGEGLWRWKLEEAKQENSYPLTNELITKTIQYLTSKEDKRRLQVYPSKSTYEEQENINLNGVLYNESYEPINEPDLALKLKDEQGKIFDYTFNKLNKNYQLSIGSLPKGQYTFVATTTLGGKNYRTDGTFFVNELIAEYQQTTANHQLLYAMAELNKGKMYQAQQLMDIVKDLEANEQLKTISYEDQKDEEIINFKWIFALILTILSLEWFLRKRNGEI